MNQKTVQELGAWLGLYRKPDNKFYWIDGTPVEGQFSAWAGGEPNNNNGVERCGNIYGSKQSVRGQWNDVPCNLTDKDLWRAPVVLCEKKLE